MWKRRIGRLGWRSPGTHRRRVVLIYHSVGGGPLSTPVEQFCAQLDWLARNARMVSLEEMLRSPSANSRLQVSLTFDDGYDTVYSLAAPLLSERGFPATVYLTTGMIGENGHRVSDTALGHYPDEKFLVWKEVLDLAGMGWTIGSHGVDHVGLTTLPVNEAARQLKVSRDEIGNRLGRECLHFSYTWGRHDRNIRRYVSEAGYRDAAGSIQGALVTQTDRFALPRIDVRREYTLDDFVSIVNGEWDYLAYWQRARRGIK